MMVKEKRIPMSNANKNVRGQPGTLGAIVNVQVGGQTEHGGKSDMR